jgi:hypothetical protein
MNRTIEYIAVTLIGIAIAAFVATSASRYISAQFERSTATFEAVK